MEGESNIGPAPMGHPAIHETVIALVSENKCKRILDIPAGEGALARDLLKIGHDVVCADLHPEIFKLTNAEAIGGDLDSKLPFEDNEFEMVICVEGLEHIENPANAIREFRRIIESGGKLIISVPNIQNVEERIKWLIFGYTSYFKPLSKAVLDEISNEYRGIEKAALHINAISDSEVRYLLENSDFTLERVLRDKKKSRGWLFLPLVWMIRLIGRLGQREKREQRWSNELNSDPVLYGGNTLIFEARRQ